MVSIADRFNTMNNIRRCLFFSFLFFSPSLGFDMGLDDVCKIENNERFLLNNFLTLDI